MQLWHRKLRHASLSVISTAIKNRAILGLPDLDINNKIFCGDCQISKQTTSSHKSVEECYTNRVLELLHMDLMGPMQTENLVGKK